MKVYVWDLKSKSNAYIPPSMIAPDGESKIICVCWKWAGEKKVHSVEWTRKGHNDKRAVKAIIQAMDQATELIGQNGDRFDIPWIRGRAIYHYLPMRPRFPTLDTLKQSRGLFRFPSYRLDYMGQHLLGEGKIPTSFGLWTSIVEQNSPEGMAKMVKYCSQDVRLLERIYNRMSPYMEPISHVGTYARDCPECGRQATAKGYRTRKSGRVYVQLYCVKCPKWFGLTLNQYKADRSLPRRRK